MSRHNKPVGPWRHRLGPRRRRWRPGRPDSAGLIARDGADSSEDKASSKLSEAIHAAIPPAPVIHYSPEGVDGRGVSRLDLNPGSLPRFEGQVKETARRQPPRRLWALFARDSPPTETTSAIREDRAQSDEVNARMGSSWPGE
jgi:hypothetical protein